MMLSGSAVARVSVVLVCGGLVGACSTLSEVINPTDHEIRMNVPPRERGLEGLERLAVYPVKNVADRTENNLATRELEAVLVGAGLEGEPRFELLAVSDLGTLTEQAEIEREARRGEFDQRSVEILQARGVEGVLVAALKETTANESYEEETDEGVSQCVRRVATANLIPRVVSTRTASLVFSKDYLGEASERVCDNELGVTTELIKVARADAYRELIRDVAPYTITRKVKLPSTFCRDGRSSGAVAMIDRTVKGAACDPAQVPEEVIEVVAIGATNARKNRIDRACRLWNGIGDEQGESFLVPYLQGVCAEVDGDIDVATRLYAVADARAAEPEPAIDSALERMATERSDAPADTVALEPVPDPNVRRAQSFLNDAGYEAGPADGLWGEKTSDAVREFQTDYGLEITGRLDQDTRVTMGL